MISAFGVIHKSANAANQVARLARSGNRYAENKQFKRTMGKLTGQIIARQGRKVRLRPVNRV